MINYIFKKCGPALAIVAGLLCSCSVEQRSDQSLTLDVSLSATEVKPVYGPYSGSAELDVVWHSGDKISINGIRSNALSSVADGKTQASFTLEGYIPRPYKVLYPASDKADVISLPSRQVYAEDSYDSAAAAAYGTAVESGSSLGVSMKHFCGFIRFAVNGNASLDRIELNSLGDEKLFGDFMLEEDGPAFTGKFSGGKDGTLVYDCKGQVLSDTDKYFYIAIPAQDYKSGLEALLYAEEGAPMRLKFWETGMKMEAGKVITMPVRSYASGTSEDILTPGDLSAISGGAPSGSPVGITVATYNVFKQSERERLGATHMYLTIPTVRNALGEAIVETRADIIAFNEIDSSFLSGTYGLENLAESAGLSNSYSWHLNHPDHIYEDFNLLWITYYGVNYQFANGFAYDSNTLTMLDHNYVWFDESDGSYYGDRDHAYGHTNDPARTCVYARFRHIQSGKVFMFFVTHLPTEEHGYQSEAVVSLVNCVTDKSAGLPQICVGDMNVGSGNSVYSQLTNYWTDVYDQLEADGNLAEFYRHFPGTTTGRKHSYEDILNYMKSGGRRIDHIFIHNGTTQNLRAKSYRTIRDTYEYNGDVTLPSDHVPVVSHIIFE